MSILESIKEIETKVEELKEQSTMKVTALMEDVKKSTEAQIKEMFLQAEETQQKRDQDFIKSLASTEQEIIARFKEQDRLVSDLAKERIDKAVEYIVEKVMLL